MLCRIFICRCSLHGELSIMLLPCCSLYFGSSLSGKFVLEKNGSNIMNEEQNDNDASLLGQHHEGMYDESGNETSCLVPTFLPEDFTFFLRRLRHLGSKLWMDSMPHSFGSHSTLCFEISPLTPPLTRSVWFRPISALGRSDD